MNGRLRVGVAALGLAFVLAIALGATGVFTPKDQRTAAAASTTLTVITGPVFVRHLTADFGPAEDGSILGPGDTVKTGSGARAVLTYFEGSTVEIEPDSELTIDTAHANPDGSTVIVMQQDLGTTWHVVTKLVQGDSKYEVHTTAATASVRGTAFTVGVAGDGTTTETTTDGAVANSDSQGQATVLTPPGLQTTTKKGEKPADPVKAPEPERKVTVTVADQSGLVVDALGRSNGIKDGKTIVQTPGAQVRLVNGQLVVTLPNAPDGILATHLEKTGAIERDVQVLTKVEEKGKSTVEVKETVKPAISPVTGVDVTTNPTNGTPTVEVKTTDELKEFKLKGPKVGVAPPAPKADAVKRAEDAVKAIEANREGKPNPNGQPNPNTDQNGSAGATGATGASGQRTGDRTNTDGRDGGAGTGTTDANRPAGASGSTRTQDPATGGSTSNKEDAGRNEGSPPTPGFFPIINLPPVLGPAQGDRQNERGTPNTDNGPTKPRPSIDRPANNGPANNGPANNGPANNGPANNGPANNGPANNGPANNGPANNGPANNGPANNGPANNGPANTFEGRAGTIIKDLLPSKSNNKNDNNNSKPKNRNSENRSRGD